MTSERFDQLIARIDQLNSEDPNTKTVEGVQYPWELFYSQRMTEWVLRLDPQASEVLRLAARGQHLQRWTIPRHQYPMNRQGYLRWRETLKTFHAQKVGELMREVGYPEEMIQRVQRIMSKRYLQNDPEAQTLEDALCLVFLETQFAELRQKTPDDKMQDIVRKTWKKMSERARQLALQLPLGETEKRWLSQTLSAEG